MFKNILIVCVGNICRSPSAERILQKELPDKEVTSAGLGALMGKGIEDKASSILTAHSYNVQNHSARQLNDKIINDADMVLVMEKSHQNSIMKLYPLASGKVMLLGKWNNNEEIPDPYQKNEQAFINAFEKIEQNCKLWAEKLA